MTLIECTSALKQLANNKSPGIDGFSTNFYKFFGIDIKTLLYESYLYSFKNNLLTNKQRIEILNLLPQKRQRFKEIAKLETCHFIENRLRLQKVIPNIIESDQVDISKIDILAKM